jgi:hypothetical protein
MIDPKSKIPHVFLETLDELELLIERGRAR